LLFLILGLPFDLKESDIQRDSSIHWLICAVATNLLHRIDDMVGEESVVLIKRCMIPYEHLPKSAKFLHIFGVIR